MDHESPRQALQRAVREGYELLHIVADGIVSLAYEGILYVPDHFQLRDPTSPKIPPSELSGLLRGSRVRVLALSPPQGNPDVVPIGGYLAPSAHRAFSYLGRSSLPLPSIVAPLGPLDDQVLFKFWDGYYRGLGETLRIEEAMAQGQLDVWGEKYDPIAMALFLRQPHQYLFRRRPPTGRTTEEDPTQVQVQLEVSQDLVARLRVMGTHYDELPENVTKFIDRESARQERLATELDPWLQPPEDEQ
jgi:hypothetical protein